MPCAGNVWVLPHTCRHTFGPSSCAPSLVLMYTPRRSPLHNARTGLQMRVLPSDSTCHVAADLPVRGGRRLLEAAIRHVSKRQCLDPSAGPRRRISMAPRDESAQLNVLKSRRIQN
eukprot:352800-Chlamydomonas_euryale.AAC.16